MLRGYVTVDADGRKVPVEDSLGHRAYRGQRPDDRGQCRVAPPHGNQGAPGPLHLERSGQHEWHHYQRCQNAGRRVEERRPDPDWRDDTLVLRDGDGGGRCAPAGARGGKPPLHRDHHGRPGSRQEAGSAEQDHQASGGGVFRGQRNRHELRALQPDGWRTHQDAQGDQCPARRHFPGQYYRGIAALPALRHGAQYRQWPAAAGPARRYPDQQHGGLPRDSRRRKRALPGHGQRCGA